MGATVLEAPAATDRLSRARPGLSTLLVHVQPEAEAQPRLEAASDLARRSGAALYGVGAEMIPAEATTDPYGYMGGAWVAEVQKVIAQNLRKAEALFVEKAKGLEAQWTAVEDTPAAAMARISRGADLIVAGGSPLDYRDGYRWCDPGKLMLETGRPVLVVPPHGAKLRLEAAVIAWKDTRESRRALADALPLLACADEVVVLEVCGERETEDAEVHTAAVVRGLTRHGVKARPKVVPAPPERVAVELNIEAQAIGADLIVAGGYGHSRMGEWVFGGVTYDLLHHPERFVLFSH
jgi:nucleotide-binding universal stress UspA family protein